HRRDREPHQQLRPTQRRPASGPWSAIRQEAGGSSEGRRRRRSVSTDRVVESITSPEAFEANRRREREANLEAENAQLRADSEASRLAALAAEHHLPAAVAELLRGLPAAQQEAKAREIGLSFTPRTETPSPVEGSSW